MPVNFVHDGDGAVLQIMEMIYRVTTEKGGNYHAIADSLPEVICAYITRYLKKDCKYEFYFSRVFSTKTGRSPRAYRKSHAASE